MNEDRIGHVMKGVAWAAIVVVLGAWLYRLMAPPSWPSFESVEAYPQP